MAQSVNLKPFYVALGVIAVAGGAWIVTASGGTTVTIPEMATGSAFPGYSLGSDSAKVEIIEYADFECPACAMFTILTSPDVKTRLVNTGRVRWTFRDFPLPMHPKAPVAHLAAACAGDQSQFWAMHDQLFYNRGAWVEGRARNLIDGGASRCEINWNDRHGPSYPWRHQGYCGGPYPWQAGVPQNEPQSDPR